MKEKVILAEQPEYDMEAIRRKAREIFEEGGFRPAGKRVFVKPSFVYPARPPLNIGVITQPAFIGGVVRAMRDMGAKAVMVGEDSFIGPSRVAFVASGAEPFLKGVAEQVYFKSEERASVEVPTPLIQERFLVPKRWLDADLFVSLPKIKVNIFADVTLSVKNNFGFLRAKDRLLHHDHNLHRKIADLYKVRPPDFVLADSIVAGEGQGPMHATPVDLGVMLGGRNGLAVDTAACELTGFRPDEIEHLRLLHAQGVGPLSLDKVDLVNPDLLTAHRKVLTRPRSDFEDMRPYVGVYSGSSVSCVSGCRGMVRNTLDAWVVAGRTSHLDGFHFICGKPVDGLPSRLNPSKTFVVGDCAIEHRRRGTFIPGCPPYPLALVVEIGKKFRFAPIMTGRRDVLKGIFAHLFRR